MADSASFARRLRSINTMAVSAIAGIASSSIDTM
jgi:hypothetical protein